MALYHSQLSLKPSPSLPAFVKKEGHAWFTTKRIDSNDDALTLGSHLRNPTRRGSTAVTRGSIPPRCHRPRGIPLSMEGDFSSPLYWNTLYVEEGATGQPTEWHLNADAFQRPLERFLGPPRKDVAILNVGCGTSNLWASMYDNGWQNITNIDFSETCIENGKRRSADRPGVRWLVADACKLPTSEFPDNTFGGAVDKGTLDVIACSEAFDWLLPRMAKSIVRVLRPGGTWACLAFSQPDLILPLLRECEEWTLEVEKLDGFWMYIGTKQRQSGDTRKNDALPSSK